MQSLDPFTSKKQFVNVALTQLAVDILTILAKGEKSVNPLLHLLHHLSRLKSSGMSCLNSLTFKRSKSTRSSKMDSFLKSNDRHGTTALSSIEKKQKGSQTMISIVFSK